MVKTKATLIKMCSKQKVKNIKNQLSYGRKIIASLNWNRLRIRTRLMLKWTLSSGLLFYWVFLVSKKLNCNGFYQQNYDATFSNYAKNNHDTIYQRTFINNRSKNTHSETHAHFKVWMSKYTNIAAQRNIERDRERVVSISSSTTVN